MLEPATATFEVSPLQRIGFITTCLRQLSDDSVEPLQTLDSEAEPVQQIENEAEGAVNSVAADESLIQAFVLSGKSRRYHSSALY